MSRLALAAVLVAACGHGDRAAAEPDPTPQLALAAVPPAELCVTKGALAAGSAAPLARVDVPTFRAVAPGHAGDAAAIRVVVHGQSEQTRALASGQLRRQLGLKLRAANGCNLVYVMWRLDPRPKIDVSVKENPGARNAKECGADGYTKIRPARSSHALPALDDGAPHELAAEIDGDRLAVWVDGHVAWRGALPASARALAGPAGVRSDNLAFDLVGFSADQRAGAKEHLRCHTDEGD
jgi:hypothetical protein